jgi:hypothetical protein
LTAHLITHHCHKKEFILKFAEDRQSWIGWIFEAKKRYGMVVLNYPQVPQMGVLAQVCQES